MALQVWLPLNGDLHNQGLRGDVTVTNNGATVSDNGKIGKCYSFDGTDDYIDLGNIHSYFTGQSNPFSICFWIKSFENTTRGVIFSSYSPGTKFFSIEINSGVTTNNSLRFDWAGDGDNLDIASNVIIEYNKWIHISVTYDGSEINFYKNGKLIQNVTNVLSNLSAVNSWKIGRDSRTGATALHGSINDFRIYDHCLSAKEVHEIAKGLVLHYKLSDSDFYKYSNNMILDSYYNEAPWTLAKAGTEIYKGKDAILVAANVLYTQTGKGTTSIFPDMQFEPQTQYTIYLNWCDHLRTDTYSTNMEICFKYDDGTFSPWMISPTANTDAEWKHNTLTSELGKNVISILATYAHAGIVSISDFKIIKFTANISDTSGYRNDGLITGTFTTSEDTPRYDVSTEFTTTSYIRVLNRPVDFLPKDAITVNLWMKYKTYAKNVISCTQTGGFNFENDSTYGLQFPVYASGYKASRSNVPAAQLANRWHMITGTFNNTIAKIYIDGEEKGSVSTSGNSIQYANNYLFIAAEAANDTIIPATSSFTGNISDVRIYSTALSAEDIKELYDTGQMIDKGGNFYCYELNEESTQPELLKTGVAKADELIEIKLLDYITSTGSQYINTGIVLNSPYNIEHYADVQFANTSTNFETICGFMSLLSGTLPRYGIHKYLQRWMIGINNTVPSSAVDTNRHKMMFITGDTNYQSLMIDDTAMINNATMSNTGYSTNNMPLYLFARNNDNTTIVNYFSGNIGRTWLKQNGEYLYDYYPCIRNGEVGMYDKVSGNFLKSDSNTDFIAGPVTAGSEINMCMCKDYILTNQLIEI